MTKTERLAWFAGIVDGEGSIGIRCSKARDGGYRWYRSYLAVAMTNEACIRLVAEIAGSGTVRTYFARSGKTVWEWRVTCHKAATVCSMLRPFLIGKTVQADAVLGLDRLNIPRVNDPRPLSPEQIAERQGLLDKIRSANANRVKIPIAARAIGVPPKVSDVPRRIAA